MEVVACRLVKRALGRMDGYFVRVATAADAASAVELLRQSITELCVEDHQNDPTTLERWLSNKTVPHLEGWIRDPGNYVVVAEVESPAPTSDDRRLVGIGLVNIRGKVHLCYVRPGCTGSGVGRLILNALEAHATEWGLPEIGLTSTINARAFYERCGYRSNGEPSLAFGLVREYPYRKVLTPDASNSAERS